MAILSHDTKQAIGRLEATLASPSISPKEAQSCARLVEKLSRPVRIGLFGPNPDDTAALLSGLLGSSPLPEGAGWPTVEIEHGEKARVTATLDDASTLVLDGIAGADLMAKSPVFLRIEAPIALLERMSFLFLAPGETADEQLAALSWAARRTDIAIWCSPRFDEDEALIWSAAPDKLKHHALLVATDWPEDEDALGRHAGLDFDGVFAVRVSLARDRRVIDRLLTRLNSDIEDAHAADIDAAQLFLHRFGHLADTVAKDRAAPKSAPEKAEPVVVEIEKPATPAQAEGPSAEVIAMVSEPLLYLKRRARALMEMLDWQAIEDGEADDRAAEILNHCNETAEGLRDRAADWSDDDRRTRVLRRVLDEACDTTILLQMEGGEEQAEDAARLLLQLRTEFERELAA
ncbi:hypothetical protein HKCCE3408_10645 [Rhodobacterales bacterium HKCCE3408]|nr:hypothetical protein [Rhodobacterales bacterium HKCCE3408]